MKIRHRDFLAAPLALFAIASAAQDSAGSVDVVTCTSNATRVQRETACSDNPSTNALRTEKKVTTTIEGASMSRPYCEAAIALEYSQRNDTVLVDGLIDNHDCGASSGDYTIEFRIRDENGELQTILLSNSWSRDDGQPVSFRKEQLIGDDVDLVRVRSRQLSCTCTEALVESEPAD